MFPKSQARASECRAKAIEAAALASSSSLRQVRKLHELSAAKWTQLAELEDRNALNLARRFGRAARVAAIRAPTLPEEDATCTV